MSAPNTDYAAFLHAKQQHTWAHGRSVDADQIHPTLFDWQAEVTAWACRTGRAAIFASCGLGKTLMQVEWARQVANRALIVAPLSVARQTVREAQKIDADVRYVRDGADAKGGGLWITNYEMIDRFDLASFEAVVLDESSILKNVDGATRRRLTQRCRPVRHRLACTATPAPNDVAELTNHAEWVGVMSRAEMLAAYFVHDDDGWRLKGHASESMFRWMASWAITLDRPSDLGWDDHGFALPALRIDADVVAVDVAPEGQLFATDLGGVGGRAKVRRETLDARCDRAIELAMSEPDEQWIVWCGLNDEADAVARGIGEDAVNVPGVWVPEAKAQALEAFQDGQIRVLVTKPSIAGFGMNFQNCARQVFCGIGDSYETYYQAIRRSWRFGQHRPVHIRIVVSELEQQIVDNVKAKEQESSWWTRRLITYAPPDVRASTTRSTVNANGNATVGTVSIRTDGAIARRPTSPML